MTSETCKLRANIEAQLDRLMKQLVELEEFRNDLSAEEYELMKGETMQQLEEFNRTLAKMSTGNITLVDELSSMRMAVQAAISQAFKTPEIIHLFAKKQPAQLRLKLEDLDREYKTKRLNEQQYAEKRAEILAALKHLKAPLSANEEEFLASCSAASTLMKQFQLASSSDDMASNATIATLVDTTMSKK